jgi:acyl dehydratase
MSSAAEDMIMLDAGPVASVLIENRTFDELEIGDSASLSRVLSRRDIELFAIVSGDANPAHLDPAYAETACSTRWSPTACGAEPSSPPFSAPSCPDPAPSISARS